MAIDVVDLDHVAVRVTDLDRALEFYHDLLGMEIRDRERFDADEVPYVAVVAGGRHVHLVPTDGDVDVGGEHLCLLLRSSEVDAKDELESLLADLRDAGVEVEDGEPPALRRVRPRVGGVRPRPRRPAGRTQTALMMGDEDPVLATHEDTLVAGAVVERPNRFVLRVRVGDETVRAFLGDPGALRVLEPGREVLCRPVDDPERSTDYDAIAVRVDDAYVSLRPALANDLFETVLELRLLPEFERYGAVAREPQLPDHGRTDFRLTAPDREAYVEVKSATHVEDGVAKFPDRQTERGRRHLRSLAALQEEGTDTHVVFVVQRPEVERFRPFREVDPAFADLLAAVHDEGVGVRALVVAFDPPAYVLRETDLPVEFV